MNGAHLHLVLNHLPVLGVGFGLLLLLAARFRRSTDLSRAALVVFVLAAGAAGLAYLTGEPAEEAVEDLAGVLHGAIESHEEAASVALALTGLLGLGALAGLVGFRRQAQPPAWFGGVMLVGSLVAGGAMAQAANLGGQIRHSEIGSGIALGEGGEGGARGEGGEQGSGDEGEEDGDEGGERKR
jgi:uncharacterized membrane protein